MTGKLIVRFSIHLLFEVSTEPAKQGMLPNLSIYCTTFLALRQIRATGKHFSKTMYFGCLQKRVVPELLIGLTSPLPQSLLPTPTFRSLYCIFGAYTIASLPSSTAGVAWIHHFPWLCGKKKRSRSQTAVVRTNKQIESRNKHRDNGHSKLGLMSTAQLPTRRTNLACGTRDQKQNLANIEFFSNSCCRLLLLFDI